MATFIPAPTAFSTVPAYQSNPFVSGYEMAVTGNTTLTVNSGAARALTNNYIIQYPSFSPSVPGVITVDVSTVGLNGCFPVSIASLGLSYNTLFPVYVIANSSGTFAANSIDASTPTFSSAGPAVVVATGSNFLPNGFDMFRRIGWVFIDESNGHLINMVQSGHGNDRTYLIPAPVAALSGGNQTGATAVDLSVHSGVVPASAGIIVTLSVAFTANSAGDYCELTPYNLSSVAGVTVASPAAALMTVNQDIITGVNSSGNAAINYLVSSGSDALTLSVSGFVDSLGNTLV